MGYRSVIGVSSQDWVDDVIDHTISSPPASAAGDRYVIASAGNQALTGMLHILVLDGIGYTNALPGDIGLPVVDTGGGTGVLVSYNNASRTWVVSTVTGYAVPDTISITGGTGAGTSLSDAIAGFQVGVDITALVALNEIIRIRGNVNTPRGWYGVGSIAWDGVNTNIMTATAPNSNFIVGATLHYSSTGTEWATIGVDRITVYDGSVWIRADDPAPTVGTTCMQTTISQPIVFSGSTWGLFAATVDHTALLNLTPGNAGHTDLMTSGNVVSVVSGMGLGGGTGDIASGAIIAGGMSGDTVFQTSGVYMTSGNVVDIVSGMLLGGGGDIASGAIIAGGMSGDTVFQLSGDYLAAGWAQASGVYQASGDYALNGAVQASGVYQQSGDYLLTGWAQASGVYQASGDYALNGAVQASGVYQQSGDYILAGWAQASGEYTTSGDVVGIVSGMALGGGLGDITSGSIINGAMSGDTVFQLSGEYTTSGNVVDIVSGMLLGGGGDIASGAIIAGGMSGDTVFQLSGDFISTGWAQASGVYQQSGDYLLTGWAQASGVYMVSGADEGKWQVSGSYQQSGDYLLTGWAQASGVYMASGDDVGPWQVSGVYQNSGLYYKSGDTMYSTNFLLDPSAGGLQYAAGDAELTTSSGHILLAALNDVIFETANKTRTVINTSGVVNYYEQTGSNGLERHWLMHVNTANDSTLVLQTIPMNDNSAHSIEVDVVAVLDDGSQRAHWKLAALYYRDGAGALQQGSTVSISTIKSAGFSTADCVFGFNGGSWTLEVTGINDDVAWTAAINVVECEY